MSRVEVVSLGQLIERKTDPGADLYLAKPQGWGYRLIRFATREALREFNKRARLQPLVYDLVPKGLKIYAHQKEQAK